MRQRPRANLRTASPKRNRNTKTIKPEAIFLHAFSFHVALQALREHKPLHLTGPRTLDIPTAVIGALCIELLLKALICIETGRNPKGHHLLHLFNALSVKTRNRITQFWDGYAAVHAHRWIEFDTLFGKPVPRDLPTALLLGGRTFELARYYYEEAGEFVFYIGILPDMLGTVVYELRPDWKVNAAKGYDALGIGRPPELKDITVEG
jgi:hypothetical protein